MNRLFYYTICAFAGALLLASCDKNEPPKFDDANAFVAFGASKVSISEATVKPSGAIIDNASTLKIPVTVASVKGLSGTFKFEIIDTVNTYSKEKDGKTIDLTAHAGVNYKNLTTSGTLTFDSEHRTQYIEIQPIYFDEYTGDLKFNINLFPSDNVSLGEASSCVVTISDVNHPLTALLGEYTASSSVAAMTNPWTMTLYKDETDDHMVWIDNIFANPGWAYSDTRFYGNVDEELSKINIPFGQTSEYKYGGSTPITLYWLKSDDSAGTTGSVNVAVKKDDKGNVISLDFGEEYGIWGLFEDLGSAGYAYPQITAVKK